MLRLFIGLALLPLSGCLLWVCARTLAGVAVGTGTAAPFAAGLALALAAWLVGRHLLAHAGGVLGWGARAARWSQVLGHELTHALAAWALGGSVFAVKVGEREGHVDLSRSGAFVALAPYCFPLYAALVAVGYRLLLWVQPEVRGEALFLLLMGAALGGHLLFTWDSLTGARQPDLEAAGGRMFSWSLIALANALIVLLILKGLFPDAVPLLARLGEAASGAARLWARAWIELGPGLRRAWSGLVR